MPEVSKMVTCWISRDLAGEAGDIRSLALTEPDLQCALVPHAYNRSYS
jgi:hypothetical protein